MIACWRACAMPATSSAGSIDDVLQPCLDSRWEFVRGNEYRPARYRPAPSYHERLRVELLIGAWQRASRRPVGADALESMARDLAAATAALAAHLALPVALLRRAAAERLVDAAAEERLHRQIRKGMLEFAEHDIRHLAIAAALDGGGDHRCAVRRYGYAVDARAAARASRAHIAGRRTRRARTEARASSQRPLGADRDLRASPWRFSSRAGAAATLHACAASR